MSTDIAQRGMNKASDRASRYGTPEERFWKRVSVGDGCWEWKGGTQSTGHGRFYAARKAVPAHRFAYEMMVGPIPDGLVIDHLCRNARCVRPDHLEPVTQRENIARGDNLPPINLPKTNCPAGHPYDEENTYVTPKGHQDCRECRREAGRRYRARKATKHV